MSWVELKIRCSGEDSEFIEPIASQAGALAVTMQDLHDNPVLEPGVGETPLWPELVLTALFDRDVDIDSVTQELNQRCAGKIRQIDIVELADQQWERSWMDAFEPMQFGTRLWVCPSWSEAPEPDAVVLRLDPGLAFGTGTHPTTALCLEKLASLPLDDARLLDFGCGSGILAIAALLLGARFALCVDNDPQALAATHNNRLANDIAESAIRCADSLGTDAGRFDLVIANILAQPLIDHAGELIDCLQPGGRLLLSGILEEQLESVQAAYQQQITFDVPTLHDGWALLHGVRH